MNRDGRRFPGTVTEVKPATSLEPALFEVTFIDGDVEDYERSELEPLLVTDAQHAINTARYHAEEAAAVAATTATEEPTDPKAASAAGGERKRKRFTPEEVAALKAGMERYYTNPESNPRFQKQPYVYILRDPDFKILADNGRENVHLKDKWRQLERLADKEEAMRGAEL